MLYYLIVRCLPLTVNYLAASIPLRLVRRAKVFAILCCVYISACEAKTIFFDDFDNEPADDGNPQNYVSFGTSIASVAVNSDNPHSGSQAMDFKMHFLPNTWGGGVSVHKFKPVSFQEAVFSIWVISTKDFADLKAPMTFRIEDEDGTVMLANSRKMFTPGLDYKEYSLNATELTKLDSRGNDSKLDLDKIVSFGFCFYNYGQVDEIVDFYIDDFKVENNGLNDSIELVRSSESKTFYVDESSKAGKPAIIKTSGGIDPTRDNPPLASATPAVSGGDPLPSSNPVQTVTVSPASLLISGSDATESSIIPEKPVINKTVLRRNNILHHRRSSQIVCRLFQ